MVMFLLDKKGQPPKKTRHPPWDSGVNEEQAKALPISQSEPKQQTQTRGRNLELRLLVLELVPSHQLTWRMFGGPLKGNSLPTPPNVRFHVDWWEGILGEVTLQSKNQTTYLGVTYFETSTQPKAARQAEKHTWAGGSGQKVHLLWHWDRPYDSPFST